MTPSMRPDERVIVFTRYPAPGLAKTRLISVLGEYGAAELQRRMTRRVLNRAQGLVRERGVSLEVRFEGGDEPRMRAHFGKRYLYRPQDHGDLGRRVERAFQQAFSEGATRVLLVGSDCPGVTSDLLAHGLDALKRTPLVIGPATDGGYYLIGLAQHVPELFQNIAWGTSSVLDHTRQIAEGRGLDVTRLDPLSDVDRPEDLACWHEAVGSGGAKRISVVIPALNEEAAIGTAVSGALLGWEVEVVVVDGGSVDSTREVAKACGARVLQTEPSRALQMNRGAAAAEGEILLFLHADTELPDGFDGLVRKALRDPGVAGGAFRFGTDYDSRMMRIIESLVNWRSQRLQMPYGDQGIFVRRSLFDTVEGFPNMPIMEDFAFVRRLRAQGRLVLLPAAVVTSGRRWRTRGILATTLLNQLVIAGYKLGVSPQRLAGWYGRDANRGRVRER